MYAVLIGILMGMGAIIFVPITKPVAIDKKIDS